VYRCRRIRVISIIYVFFLPVLLQVAGLPVLGECKAVTYTPSIDYSTPNM
jgi:hypothetical protein